MNISKLDAARRQLEAGVTHYFSRRAQKSVARGVLEFYGCQRKSLDDAAGPVQNGRRDGVVVWRARPFRFEAQRKSMKEHYAAVLADLQQRKSNLEAELRDIDVMIGGLKRLVGGDVLLQGILPSPQGSPLALGLAQAIDRLPGVNLALHESRSRFSNLSVRWGLIWYLAEDVDNLRVGESAKTGEIANALLTGGYRSQAERFPNLVSAVLSGMKTKGEVEISEDGGYRLTDQGRHTWQSIRHSAKFRNAISNELLLLGVQ